MNDYRKELDVVVNVGGMIFLATWFAALALVLILD